MMNERWKSDDSIVPKKQPNNAPVQGAAEVVEGREKVKGGTHQRRTRPGRRAGQACTARLRGYAKQHAETRT
jgi:hypothetical protein